MPASPCNGKGYLCYGRGNPCGCKYLGRWQEGDAVARSAGRSPRCSAHLCCRCTPCFPKDKTPFLHPDPLVSLLIAGTGRCNSRKGSCHLFWGARASETPAAGSTASTQAGLSDLQHERGAPRAARSETSAESSLFARQRERFGGCFTARHAVTHPLAGARKGKRRLMGLKLLLSSCRKRGTQSCRGTGGGQAPSPLPPQGQ